MRVSVELSDLIPWLHALPRRSPGATVRFSGGFAGPGPSTIGRLSGQDGAPSLLESRTVAMFPGPLLALC